MGDNTLSTFRLLLSTVFPQPISAFSSRYPLTLPTIVDNHVENFAPKSACLGVLRPRAFHTAATGYLLLRWRSSTVSSVT